MVQKVSDQFHLYYDNNKLWELTTWLGVSCWKLPFDAWIYQEVIFKVKPDIIIETGTAFGGSALFFASICDLIGKGGVITVDIEDKTNGVLQQDHKIKELWNKRVQCIIGSSIDTATITTITDAVKYSGAQTVMVILDSWHTKDHVLQELNLYNSLVSVGSYLIVEDTHVNNPVKWKWGEGPFEAVQEFLATNNKFAIDETCEKLIMSFNPKGWLKRIV